PDTEGITINFGTDAAGMGEMAPQQQEFQQPDPPASVVAPPIKTKPVKEKVKETAPKLLTQETEPAPTLKKQDNEKDLAEKKKLDEKKQREKEERELQRQADLERRRIEAEQKRQVDLENQRIEAERKKQVQQQSQIDAKKKLMGKSFGGNSTATGTQGEGNSQAAGNQGDPTGSVDSKNQGPGGGKGAGISYNLGGRNVIGSLAKPEYTVNEYGDVVVIITVNKDGDVISAVPGAKGTTTTNSTLWEAARKAASSAKFNRVTSTDAPVYQKGTITYKFKLL
ncbi:MAG: cell envelope integrity protein TolA, partial [Bacteroidia bacterium]|nr:cell envelope integrity protein TolA [Bacteroidia bacterium]